MIDGRGRARLTDFGLAVAVAARRASTRSRARRPTCPPSSSRAARLTPRSDLYALGLILYEMLTGRRFFEAQTLEELGAQHREAKAAAARQRGAADVGPAPERVVQQCLEEDPEAPARVRAGGPRAAARRRSAGGRAGGGGDAVAGGRWPRRRRSATCRAGAGLGLLWPRRWRRSAVAAWLCDARHVSSRAPCPSRRRSSPSARARSLGAPGARSRPPDDAYSFEWDRRLPRHVVAARSGRPTAGRAWRGQPLRAAVVLLPPEPAQADRRATATGWSAPTTRRSTCRAWRGRAGPARPAADASWPCRRGGAAPQALAGARLVGRCSQEAGLDPSAFQRRRPRSGRPRSTPTARPRGRAPTRRRRPSRSGSRRPPITAGPSGSRCCRRGRRRPHAGPRARADAGGAEAALVVLALAMPWGRAPGAAQPAPRPRRPQGRVPRRALRLRRPTAGAALPRRPRRQLRRRAVDPDQGVRLSVLLGGPGLAALHGPRAATRGGAGPAC